jgi:hypothetical protein
MSNWMTVDEICARYAVGGQKLLDYSLRGNLPLMRRPDGTTLFDESVVARLFRPRDGQMSISRPSGPNLGVLGFSRLGEKPAEAARTAAPPHLGQRFPDRRRRRVSKAEWPAHLERRKAATG